MATADYIISNQSGAAFRTDLNNTLAAIVSNNSNSSAPSTTYAYQWWADTTNGVLKIRNSANNAWVTLLQLDGTLTLEDGSASTPGLAFRDDLNTGVFSAAADTFNVATGGVERLRLDSSGFCGVNSTDPKAQLQVNSDKNAETDRHDGSNYHLFLRNPADDSGEAAGLAFSVTSNATKVGAAIMHEREGGGSQGSLQFYTNGDGNSTSERMRILAGGGITFNGDTAAANALDDYEEGTWTPAPRFGGGNTGMSASLEAPVYTKIGRMVTVKFGIVFSNKGSSTGGFTIEGLPFTATQGSFSHFCGSVIVFNGPNADGNMTAFANSAVLNFRKHNAANANADPTESDFDNDTSIMGSLTYFI